MTERRVKKITPTMRRKKERIIELSSQLSLEDLQWLEPLAHFSYENWAQTFVIDVEKGVYNLYLPRLTKAVLDKYESEYKNSRPVQADDIRRKLDWARAEAIKLVHDHGVRAPGGHGYLEVTSQNAVIIIEKYRQKKLPPPDVIRRIDKQITLSAKQSEKPGKDTPTYFPPERPFGPSKRPNTRVRKRRVGPPMVQSVPEVKQAKETK